MLGPAYVEYIHDELVSMLWPGSDPVDKDEYRDRGLLESAVGRPFQTAFGADAYPTILEKGAALFQSLIANHPFGNANKRTGIIALEQFLVANSYLAFFENHEAYELARSTASYRARGLTHIESLEEIRAALNLGVFTFAAVGSLKAIDVPVTKIVADARKVSRAIRKDPRNKLI